jgi:hypothetical protein
MDVGERPRELVEVEFDIQQGQGNLGLMMLAAYGVHGFGDVFEDKVQVELVLFFALGGIERGRRVGSG